MKRKKTSRLGPYLGARGIKAQSVARASAGAAARAQSACGAAGAHVGCGRGTVCMPETICSSTPPGPPLGVHSLLWATEGARRRFFANAWEMAPAHLPGVDRMLGGAQLHTELLGLDELTVINLARRLDRDALGGNGHAATGVPSHLEAASNDATKCERGLTHCKVRCVEWGAGCADHHLARGWSLVLNSAHTLHAGLHHLVAEWWSTFGVYVGVNLYMSPAAREHSAFGYHADEADIFVLQLQGSKLWSVCERVLPAANAPPVRWEDGPAGVGRNCTEIELRRGDTLYLPVGVSADPAREPSATETRGPVAAGGHGTPGDA